MMKQFTKKDLKIGYLVRHRNGTLKMVMPIQSGSPEKCLLVLVSSTGLWSELNAYSEDLISKCASSKGTLDVLEVYGYSEYSTTALEFNTSHRHLLWKREEPKKEMTIADIEKELGYSIKIIKESEEN